MRLLGVSFSLSWFWEDPADLLVGKRLLLTVAGAVLLPEGTGTVLSLLCPSGGEFAQEEILAFCSARAESAQED